MKLCRMVKKTQLLHKMLSKKIMPIYIIAVKANISSVEIENKMDGDGFTT